MKPLHPRSLGRALGHHTRPQHERVELTPAERRAFRRLQRNLWGRCGRLRLTLRSEVLLFGTRTRAHAKELTAAALIGASLLLVAVDTRWTVVAILALGVWLVTEMDRNRRIQPGRAGRAWPPLQRQMPPTRAPLRRPTTPFGGRDDA